jgi:hypothetical protein
MVKKLIFSIFALLLIVSTVNAQEGKLGATIFGGYANSSSGSDKFEISIHPHYNLGNRFAIEGQFSFMFYEGTGMLGQQLTNNTNHYLVGGRYYFTKPERNWRPYVNALFGLLEAQHSDMNTFGFYGGSLGAYVTHKKGFTFGVAYQTETNFIFKVGYRF